jgi:hypothetical protein
LGSPSWLLSIVEEEGNEKDKNHSTEDGQFEKANAVILVVASGIFHHCDVFMIGHFILPILIFTSI